MWTSTALHRCGVLALPAGGRAGAPRAVSRVARPPAARTPTVAIATRWSADATRRDARASSAPCAPTRHRRLQDARVAARSARLAPRSGRLLGGANGAGARRAVHARDPAGSTDRDEPAVGAPSRSRSRAGVRARAPGPEPGTTLRPTVGGRVRDEFPPEPPAVTYEELAPCVELARVAHAPRRSGRAHREPTLPVLVGWFGCERKHLRKYAQMYLSRELGYDAVILIVPPAAATLFPALGDAFAATALGAVTKAQRTLSNEAAAAAALEGASARGAETSNATSTGRDRTSAAERRRTPPLACDLADRPVHLHLFSNGGYLFAGNVMHAQTGFAAETEQTLTSAVTTALRRRLGLAPEPAAARRFAVSVASLVIDSAPGELEPGMVGASFEAVLTSSAADAAAAAESNARTNAYGVAEPSSSSSRETFAGAVPVGNNAARLSEQVAAATLAWPPIAKRMRYVDAAWGGFPAVTGARWSGDRRSRPGNAAEVARAAATRKLAEMRLANADGSRTGAKIARDLAENVPGGRGILWCPAMFMYSKADALIPHEQVEAFATARAQRLGRLAPPGGSGAGLVVMKRWDDAKHCEIGRVDPEGYKAALLEFLNPFEDAVTERAANNVKPWNRP